MSEQQLALHWLVVGYVSDGAKAWIEEAGGRDWLCVVRAGVLRDVHAGEPIKEWQVIMKRELTPEEQNAALQRMLNAARKATAQGATIHETVDAVVQEREHAVNELLRGGRKQRLYGISTSQRVEGSK